MTGILGVDLSHHNRDPLDFHKMASSGIQFVGLKVSEGARNQDPTFHDRRDRVDEYMHDVIKVIPCYHFFHPLEDPELQADNYAAMLGALITADGEMVACDLEATAGWDQLNPKQSADAVISWVAAIKRKLDADNTVIIDDDFLLYGSMGWLRGQFGDQLQRLTFMKLWAARYGPSLGDVSPWDHATIWQYGEYGRVPGAGNGDVDTDVWLDTSTWPK